MRQSTTYNASYAFAPSHRYYIIVHEFKGTSLCLIATMVTLWEGVIASSGQ